MCPRSVNKAFNNTPDSPNKSVKQNLSKARTHVRYCLKCDQRLREIDAKKLAQVEKGNVVMIGLIHDPCPETEEVNDVSRTS